MPVCSEKLGPADETLLIGGDLQEAGVAPAGVGVKNFVARDFHRQSPISSPAQRQHVRSGRAHTIRVFGFAPSVARMTKPRTPHSKFCWQAFQLSKCFRLSMQVARMLPSPQCAGWRSIPLYAVIGPTRPLGDMHVEICSNRLAALVGGAVWRQPRPIRTGDYHSGSAGAGGGTDVQTRIMIDKLADRLGQRIIVENRAGAAATSRRRPSRAPRPMATRSS